MIIMINVPISEAQRGIKMDAFALASLGTTWQNGMVIANLGYSSKYIPLIRDIIELESPLQTEVDMYVHLYSADINIEADLPIELNIYTHIKKGIDLESKLQIETNIKTKLVREL